VDLGAELTVDRRRGDSGATRLVGRDEILGELTALVQGRWDLPTGAVVVEGAPGLGKTAVVNSACHVARQSGVRVLRARCAVQESTAPLGVLQQLAAQIQAGDRPFGGEVRDLLRRTRGGGLPDDELLELFGSLEEALFDRGPAQAVLVAVDDVHWCDPASTAWLHYLVRRIEIRPLRLVLSMTAQAPGLGLTPLDRLLHESSTRRVELGPLTVEQVDTFLTDSIGAPAGEEVAAAYHYATSGSPFLLSALLRATGGAGPLDPTELLSRLEETSPPEVSRALAHALEPLGPEPLEVLQAAVVLDGDATPANLATMVGTEVADVERAAEALRDLSLVRAGWPLRCEYPLIASVVHQMIPPDELEQAHTRAALILEEADAPAWVQARHVAETAPSGDAARAALLLAGGREAHAAEEHVAARALLVRALDEPPPSELHADTLVALALVESRLHEPAAIDRLREATRLGADPAAVARATLTVLWNDAGSADPSAVLDSMEVVLKELGPDEPELAAHLELARELFTRDATTPPAVVDHDATGLERAHHAIRLADQVSPDGARELAGELQHGFTAPDLLDHDPVTALIRIRAALTLLRVGQIDAGSRHVDSLLAASAAVEEHPLRNVLLSLATRAAVLRGDVAAALEHDAAEAALDRHANPGFRALTTAWRHELAVLTDGEHHDLPALEAELADLAARGPHPSVQEPFATVEALGRSHLDAGRPDEALAAFTTAAEWATDRGVDNPAITEWRMGQARARAALGDTATAIELAREQVALARTFGAAPALGRSLRGLAAVVPDSERVAVLTEAVQLLNSAGTPIERARAMLDLGVAQRAAGNVTAARRSLRAAADVSFHCGVDSLVRISRDELLAAGARPRRLALTGIEALSPAEQRVAELASAGATNAAIAATLFVAPKTVESHLARVYRKLGITSRSELREALEQG
jgi:DNA-binding CsgD family transcriptional regulator